MLVEDMRSDAMQHGARAQGAADEGGEDGALVDFEVLEAARAEFGAEVFAEIRDALVAEVEAALTALDAAVAGGDAPAAAALCHAMFGAASTLGLTGFCAVARSIEAAAQGGSCPDRGASDRLGSAWHRSLGALRDVPCRDRPGS